MDGLEEICRKVCDVARRAGEFIAAERRHFSFDRVEFKGAHDLVSYVDRQAERIIVDGLRDVVPGAGFITEERTAGYSDEEYRWIVDPLDGTTNFVHGLPPYCVSIALMRGDEIVAGVVYEVTLREMFHTWQGAPAYMNGAEIAVSQVRSIANSLIAIGFSHGISDEKTTGDMERAARFQFRSDGIRRIGSAAADLVYVACGRFDAFEQKGLSAWDVAVGALIARRAGATVTDHAGGEDYVFGGGIVAANPHVYGELMKIMEE